jgi:tripartite-type tricarboxylate transporter receptor subunit TctC
MKKTILTLLLGISTSVFSAEQIKIYSPYSPGHSGTPALLRIIDEANASQNVYKFNLEFKPGANQLLAIRALDEKSLAIIAPAYVENVQEGKINEKDYVPVHAFGDACWAVVTNKPLKGAKEFTVGGVGFGNAAHLTSLALGEKYNFNVRYVVFKSNNDALVNMAGNNGVEMVIDKFENYEGLKTKNPAMEMIAASCPKRLPQAPNIKTLKELGIDAPYIFNIMMAHRDMPSARRDVIKQILNDATVKLGDKEIFKLSAMRPPVFDNISVEKFYETSVSTVKKLQTKYRDKIESSKK